MNNSRWNDAEWAAFMEGVIAYSENRKMSERPFYPTFGEEDAWNCGWMDAFQSHRDEKLASAAKAG